jgi:hypothetical protein
MSRLRRYQVGQGFWEFLALALTFTLSVSLLFTFPFLLSLSLTLTLTLSLQAFSLPLLFFFLFARCSCRRGHLCMLTVLLLFDEIIYGSERVKRVKGISTNL